MKTLALAGLMTLSAVAGSIITLSLSQTSFAQDNKHWTQQHPAAQAQQGTTTTTTPHVTASGYTEYMVIKVEESRELLAQQVSNAMRDGWQTTGGVEILCPQYRKCALYQSVFR